MLDNLASMKEQGIVKKIVLLINSANPLQVDFLKDNTYNVDACLWIGDVESPVSTRWLRFSRAM